MLSVPAKSMTFLTTDYRDRVPAAVADVRIAGGRLVWAANGEPEHCYYRVYRDGRQIASTVATSLDLGGSRLARLDDGGRDKRVLPVFSVKSIDKWGNVRH